MTANRRRKKRVRARMAKTGESYTAALRHLLRVEELRMQTYEIRNAGVTDIGNVRKTNEDNLLTDGDLFVVADGMGGEGRGQAASQLAIETVRAEFSADPTGDGLLSAVHKADAAVSEHAAIGPEWEGMGTTIAAVAVISNGDGQQLAVVNVGDSRVYLLRDGQLDRLSSDHSLVADLVRAGQISEADAFSHPERHVLTQALGTGADLEPHLSYTAPLAGDRLLLCSDGLFNELVEAQITEVLSVVTDPGAAATELVARAKRHGGNDNITVLVLDVD